jgi:hypothetical protein
MANITTQDWFKSLIDDVGSTWTETEFNARWTYIVGYHTIGLRILQDYDNFERSKIYGQEIVSRIAESLDRSKSTVWKIIQFAKKYPDLNKLPEGKNASWHQISNKYLSNKKGKQIEEPKGKLIVCPFCGKDFRL